MITINVGRPSEPVKLDIQSGVTETVWFRCFDGKPISASTNSSGLDLLTVTGHGLSTNDYVCVSGHDTNVGANTNRAQIVVVNANSYTVNGSVFITNGGPSGYAGKLKNINGWTGLRCQLRNAAGKDAPIIYTCTVAGTGTANDGLVGCLFVGADTLLLNTSGVFDVIGIDDTGKPKMLACGSFNFILPVTQPA